ncbi:hypothetical protein [Elizabethkingia ursingii]|jgi:hypothetical protein|uniref:Uncharacterized protein n=1 Tax=Elizabethkingia ursingii TaxID=1756150 RepID=A0AAJ3N9V4_9FLAO|nr:hypothetical protein [Elizabethkingia ursingii]MDR2228534.1 hypothetical protein [Flavobacteriaceae bacterium]AQX08341.1 hypothetical protein BBD34_06660 [Elizabethkingia ursingii]MCL1666326.1 hypothetical protein [Elizabethkingia ursingii]MCL1673671.1 hypothetical protein [Elizabethkingia ursingii]OPB72193.1 hypothetical protein BAY32_13700 [Elizabethkingia ursingii]
MQNFLKRYWYIVLIVLSVLHFLGYFVIKAMVGISDALEHVDSDRIERRLKSKDFFYTILIDSIFIIDFALVLFLVYLGGKKVLQLVLKK